MSDVQPVAKTSHCTSTQGPLVEQELGVDPPAAQNYDASHSSIRRFAGGNATCGQRSPEGDGLRIAPPKWEPVQRKVYQNNFDEAPYSDDTSPSATSGCGTDGTKSPTEVTEVPGKMAMSNCRWSSLLMEVGATASGLSLAMSHESMKRLKYCISWLQYAIAHTEHRISVLRALMDDMQSNSDKVVGTVAQQLLQIRQDVMHIIRSVICVASQYANDALPDYACKLVRQFILSLPDRWSVKNASLDLPQSMMGLMSEPEADSAPVQEPDLEKYERAASNIMALAVETLDIVRNVAQVFGDVVDRADLWVERLRMFRTSDVDTDPAKLAGEPGMDMPLLARAEAHHPVRKGTKSASVSPPAHASAIAKDSERSETERSRSPVSQKVQPAAQEYAKRGAPAKMTKGAPGKTVSGAREKAPKFGAPEKVAKRVPQEARKPTATDFPKHSQANPTKPVPSKRTEGAVPRKTAALENVALDEDEMIEDAEADEYAADEFDIDDEEEEEEEDEEEEGEEDEQDEQEDEQEDEQGKPHKANPRKNTGTAPAEFSEKQMLASIGLPAKGQLSERQKKKALAEAERLELLLKSSGYPLDGEDEQAEETGEEGDSDGDAESVDDLDGDAEENSEVPEESTDAEETLGDLEEDGESDDGADHRGEEDGIVEEEDEYVGGHHDDSLDEDEDEDDAAPTFSLPTLEEEEQEKQAPLNLQLVQMRLQEVANILGDLQRLGEPGRSRADYLERFAKDVQSYYGYNDFLTNMFLELFSPTEAIAFFEANEVPRPVTIRANTLRTRRRDLAQKLINRGASLEPVGPWSKVGLQVFESPVPIGATPEYLVGDYMLQAVSSFLPCMALAPQPSERVLDMASAPGGKATYLSALMQNTGCIFANDSNKARIKSLTANIHRMGCRNVVVCNYDGRQFPKVMGGFDRVMLDSPCSGTGVVSKDASVKTNKTKRDFILLSQLQKQLILCAIDSVTPKSETGGYVVYSTCSVTVEENEEVVEYALRKRPNVRIVPTGIDFGRDGLKSFRGKKFCDKMPLCRRIFPHVHNLDGFFVCKLKVEMPTKGAKRTADDDSREDHVPSSARPTAKPQSGAPTPSLFDASEDDAIIRRSQARQAKKRRL
ncbi:25S rRNA (cytosine(2870)-C(5))-methyltransferase [Malassezia sp. CBS 17886]|nr:25S rRNA (cytosine(2870)-C(5))-methyltransferase [Malassezia sp. CBS 17886]